MLRSSHWSTLRLSLATLAFAVLWASGPLPCNGQDAPSPGPTGEETPPTKTAPGSESGSGMEALPPLTAAQVRSRMARSERNLLLHALSLDALSHLGPAIEDYRVLHGQMSSDPPRIEASEDDRFTAAFALAFALARAPLPDDPVARETLRREFQSAADHASAIHPEFPGIAIVEGMMAVGLGQVPDGLNRLEDGLVRLERGVGLKPWQVYQLRLFGHLARGEGLLQPGIGREDLALGDFDLCLELARQAAEDPLMPAGSRLMVVVQTYRAAALQSLAYYQQAEEVLDRLMVDDPGNAMHPYHRGLIAAWQQKFEDALRFYAIAVSRGPRNPAPRLKMAYILLVHPTADQAPRVREALRHAEAYRVLTGHESAEYAACRGEAAHLEGDTAEAERWFRKALELHPDCRHALNRLIQLLGPRRGRMDEKERSELDALKTRLRGILRDRSRGSEMETAPPDVTFC